MISGKHFRDARASRPYEGAIDSGVQSSAGAPTVPARCFTTLTLRKQRGDIIKSTRGARIQVPDSWAPRILNFDPELRVREHRSAPEECISCSVLEVPCLIVLAPVSAPAMLAAPVAELALREHGITASVKVITLLQQESMDELTLARASLAQIKCRGELTQVS